MPRYKLRTLLIVMAIGPPLCALAWSMYSKSVPVWLVAAVSLFTIIPYLMVAACGYGFGGLCHLIGRLPGGIARKDTKF